MVGVFNEAEPNRPPEDEAAGAAVVLPNRPPDGAAAVFDPPRLPNNPPPACVVVGCAGLFKFPKSPPLGAAAGVLDAAGAEVVPVELPKLKEGVVVAAGFCPNNPPAAGCEPPPPNNPPPVLFASLGGGPAGVVEFPNSGFEAGVVEPAGAALVLPNNPPVVAAGLFKFPNRPPPLLGAGVLAAGVPKLNEGADVAAGAFDELVPALLNNPPLDGAVEPNEKPVPEAELEGKPVLPKLPNGFLGASDMVADVSVYCVATGPK